SEQTAAYKNKIIEENITSKNVAIDITGGFGVDTFFLSKIFKEVHYVEPNTELLSLAKHNHQQLGACNIIYHNTVAEDFIKQTSLIADLIFIDPSRRTKNQTKVFKLTDCEPDITQLQHTLFNKAPYVLIKTSPLLDIQQGLKELTGTEKIFIVSVDNECKEVLFLLKNDFHKEPVITCTNLTRQEETFTFNIKDEKTSSVKYSDPLALIY